MGYESKLYIIQKRETNKDMNYAEKIAEFNLCRMDYNGPFHKALNKMRKTNCYIYSDDGDTCIIEDKYGKNLQEINISPLIRILEKENKEYRRIQPIIDLLKSFKKEKWGVITILHYGY